MGWAARYHGRAEVDSTNPAAWGICDRCGFLYNLKDLVWQYEWNGPQLQNQRILVCTVTCLDEYQQQLRTIVIPPDPLPVLNPRPEAYAADETDFRVTEDGATRVTEDGATRILDNDAQTDSG